NASRSIAPSTVELIFVARETSSIESFRASRACCSSAPIPMRIASARPSMQLLNRRARLSRLKRAVQSAQVAEELTDDHRDITMLDIGGVIHGAHVGCRHLP